MKELTLTALPEKLDEVLDFINAALEEAECPPKTAMQTAIAVEEIFVNIAHYAYAPNNGEATVTIEIGGEPRTATITFYDKGKPYNPLERADPDVSLSAEDRKIGGLGIYMVKKSMDSVDYRYENGQNILILRKAF